jgi:CRP/FNR family transcriptional regulator
MIGMVEQLCFNTVRQRLMALFLRLATQDGRLTAHGVELTLTSTYRDLAAQIGTVPEVVSRNLGALQALGLISVQGRTVTLYNPKAIHPEAES